MFRKLKKKIFQEAKEIEQNPTPGIYVNIDESDMFSWTACIIGYAP